MRVITPSQRVGAGLLALLLGSLATLKLLDSDGYASALSSFTVVESERAYEAGTLFAAVEGTAALLLLLVALFGRHAIVAFQGGALLAMSAALAYAILVVNAYYTGQDLGTALSGAALFGTALAQAPRSPYAVVEVLLLLSWSAWMLTSAFLMPEEPRRRVSRKVRRARRAALKTAG